VAGYFGCPLVLFTGDAAAVSEMHQFLLEVEGVVVKEGIGRYSARSLHPTVARQRIREGAQRAIERLENVPVFKQEGSLDLEVDLVHPVIADVCERIPGLERRGPRTVGFVGDDYLEVFKLFLALGSIGSTAVEQR
jgi:D-amino peptidase